MLLSFWIIENSSIEYFHDVRGKPIRNILKAKFRNRFQYIIFFYETFLQCYLMIKEEYAQSNILTMFSGCQDASDHEIFFIKCFFYVTCKQMKNLLPVTL